MTVLMTGATGTVGSLTLRRLLDHDVDVRALTRSPGTAGLPRGVTAVKGDLLDVDALRGALDGAGTLFLLSANIAEELTATLQALCLAQEAGVRGIVYMSVYQGEQFTDVAHLCGKFAAEQMAGQFRLPATVLRPTYFAQNDLGLKDAILGAGVYPMPIGQEGISMIDVRDIAEAAAGELVRRERATGPLPAVTYDLVGPDVLTGPQVAGIWSQALGRPVSYGGDDLTAFEQRMRGFRPAWLAFETSRMLRRFQADGGRATTEGLDRLTGLLGHPPRRYRDLAAAAAQQWLAPPAADEP